MNTCRGQTLAILTVVALLAPVASSQQRASVPQTTTFTATDGAFNFSYPSDFQVCTAGKIDPCAAQSFIPVCDGDALVCVLYPVKQFEGTNFGAASFQVREIHREEAMMTPDICATPYPVADSTPYPDFLVSAEHPVEMIDGLQFPHGVTGDAATSHSLGVDLYRRFHKQRCLELRVSTSATSPAADPPTKTLTPAQQKRLDQSMSQILHSFRFSK
jgi:hypothetical protein